MNIKTQLQMLCNRNIMDVALSPKDWDEVIKLDEFHKPEGVYGREGMIFGMKVRRVDKEDNAKEDKAQEL